MKMNWLMILFWGYCSVSIAAISTQIDPTSVHLGESFRFTLIIEDPTAGVAPDLSPLEKDFMFVGTERSTSYTVINGQAQSVSRWSVILKAKRAGTLPIPAIRFGSEQSPPSQIEVRRSAQAVTETTKKVADKPGTQAIFLQAQVSPSAAYVNQQITYTVKLYNSQHLLDAEYQPPEVKDALLIPLGDSRHHEETLDGRYYTVEEQSYAVIPQKSGMLEIIAPSFQALVLSDMGPRRVNVRAKNMQLAIQPMPKAVAGGYWLPAKQVLLQEVYQPNTTKLMQGATLERTVTVQAVGVPAQLLPNIRFTESPDYQVYLEKPIENNSARQQALVGTVTIKATYVLGKAGTLTIPELKVDWFNTDTGQKAQAVLPARTLSVQASPMATSSTPVSSNTNRPTSLAVPNVSATAVKSSRLISSGDGGFLSLFPWIMALLFALAWGGTVWLWWRYSHKKAKPFCLKQLRRACEQNLALAAQSALIAWAAAQWPRQRFLNLNDVMMACQDPDLIEQIQRLSAALYGHKQEASWQGHALWQCVVKYRRPNIKKTQTESDLPPINPVG